MTDPTNEIAATCRACEHPPHGEKSCEVSVGYDHLNGFYECGCEFDVDTIVAERMADRDDDLICACGYGVVCGECKLAEQAKRRRVETERDALAERLAGVEALLDEVDARVAEDVNAYTARHPGNSAVALVSTSEVRAALTEPPASTAGGAK